MSEDAARPVIQLLIVDDVASIREMLATSFSMRPGFAVVGQADDGESGVGLVAALQPDVVLLDVAMPRMDGITALPLMRQAAPNACIVMLSGFDAHTNTAMECGADGYLLKGARVGEIAAELERLCGRVRATQ